MVVEHPLEGVTAEVRRLEHAAARFADGVVDPLHFRQHFVVEPPRTHGGEKRLPVCLPQVELVERINPALQALRHRVAAPRQRVVFRFLLEVERGVSRRPFILLGDISP